MTLVELNNQFSTDEQCRELLVRFRWPNGVECPKCKAKTISRLFTQKKFECSKCCYQFSVTTGTIFHDSHLPLTKWFIAVLLMCESKKGISAHQIKRMLGIGYQTAWYLCHRIRKAVEEVKDKPQLQRDGKFEARKIPTRSRQILTGIVRERVAKGSKVFTDELAAYESLAKTHKHHSVNHSAEEWVRGDVHTNSVENAWSLFKRSLVGAFHQVSEKHLDAYFDEFEWRFNNRQNPQLFRDTLLRLIASPKLEYKELIGRTS